MTKDHIIEITDLNVPELDIYARLNENQLFHIYEPGPGLFIGESPKVILRALDAGYTPVSLLVERRHIDGQAREVIERCPDVPVYTGELALLTRLTGYALTRGVLCAMRRRPLPSVEQVCAGARRICVLERVMNPTNVGAIFRSAAALNIDGLILSPSCSDPLYRRSVRVSMGTVFQIPWTRLTDQDGQESLPCLKQLKRLGFWTAALALRDDSVPLDYPPLAALEKLAIVMGSEGDGLTPETIRFCDYTVRIPMSHGVDSLNVAAASAVAFWQLAGAGRGPSHL